MSEIKGVLDDKVGLIATAVRRPVTATVFAILLCLFGALSIGALPLQLTPDLTVPTLTVTTVWPGAAPAEVEQEILEPQEEVLKTVTGLVSMESEATLGSGTVTLELEVGTDLDDALVRVSNRLNQVAAYPDTAREPVVSTASSAGPPLAVIVLSAQDGHPIPGYRTWAEQNLQPYIERIPGVAAVRVFGGQVDEVVITFDPAGLAARGLTMDAVALAVQGELRDLSAGDLDIGKRQWVVRTPVAPDTEADLEALVLRATPDGRVVRLGDVATVRRGLGKRGSFVMADGAESIVMLLDREAGSNVLETTAAVRATVDELQRARLDALGLRLAIVSDQVGYINGALDLVRDNLWVGALLAIGVLYLFLRSFTAAAVVGTAIPVCTLGAFLGLYLLDRTLNVVSLAGMAFAVGMVIDNSIVVLENIATWRHRVATVKEAAYEGVQEVWGAILASTLTTVAVFLPIIAWEGEVGELLRDVATAVTLAVLLSLVVSIIMIPPWAASLLRGDPPAASGALAGFGVRFRGAVGRMVEALCGSIPRSLAVVVGALVVTTVIGVKLVPSMEYLPTGNRNLLFGVMLPPPGYSVEEMARIGRHVQGRIVEHLRVEKDGVPAVERTFFVGRPGQAFMGASAMKDEEIGALVTFVRKVQREIPGVFGFANQASLFGRALGASRAVDVDLSGSNLGQLLMVGGKMMGRLQAALPGAQIRPLPSLDAGGPELSIHVKRKEAADLGLTPAAIGRAADALVDGRIIGELGREGEARLDVVLRPLGGGVTSPELLGTAPLATPRGEVVPLSAVADIDPEVSPLTIRRLERRRAITLQISPPAEIAMEETIRRIRADVLAPMEAEGELPPEVLVSLGGGADDLSKAQLKMGQVLLLAVLICYLLLAALFEDFLAPLVILTSLPIAAAGGMAALRLVDATLSPQPLDMMTAMGFLILIGTVVNNPILVVDGALARLREGSTLTASVREAVEGRVRPIMMTTLTTLAGLLPLVLFPGSGSELYRGIGAVVLGGLLVGTVLTLAVVPAAFQLVWRLRGVR